MLKSMTAYSRVSCSYFFGGLTVEIQSLNRKHLDIQLYLPKEFSRFETEVRKQVAGMVTRGLVTIRVEACFQEKTPLSVRPNFPLARQLNQAWQEVGQALGLKVAQEVPLSWLVSEANVLIYENEMEQEELYREKVGEAVQSALELLVKMRIREGSALQADIQQRIDLMRGYVAEVALLAKERPSRYYEKLKERVRELSSGVSLEMEARLLQEVAIYANNLDIAEEQVRFGIHLEHLQEWLSSEQKGVGKTLEFLLQEMNREVNTIGSKAADASIALLVVKLKRELECIREQLQNIE